MQLRSLHYRQSCPGGAYYVCQNGFKGCCSIDPCNPGASCPDIFSTSIAAAQTTTTVSKASPSITLVINSGSLPTTTPPLTSILSPVAPTLEPVTMTPSSTSLTSALPIATSLTCPAANMTTYTDTNKVQYSIRCNADNSYASFNSTTIITGGFSKCFPACDNFSACAGFTFVGSDGGMCYLKSNLPDDGYSTTAGGNYVTVALVDRNAQVVPPTDALPTESPNSSTNSKAVPIGVVVGGVVGGILILIVLALVIFFYMRRRRRRREEVDSATQRPKSSPFAALGGFYRGKSANTELPRKVPLDESQLYREDSVNDGFLETKQDKPPLPTTAGPAEMEGRPIYPSAQVGVPPVELDASPTMAPKTPMSPQVDESPVLGRYTSYAYTKRGTSNFADHVRRKQHGRHIMSWNNYDERSSISPPASMTGLSPRIGSPNVSPLVNSARNSAASKSPPDQYRGQYI